MSEELKLQQRIIDELTFDPAINAAHIGVSVRGAVVTLSGHVETYAEKFAAERAARRVKGVTAVAQELEVRLPADKKIADDEIALRAVKLIDWTIALPPGAIKIKVEHGIVTLAGTVEWGYQCDEAEYDVRKLGGVRGIVNQLVVRPRAQSADVRAKILAAFERSAEVEANRISVEVINGNVVLGGKVDSWIERQEAERAAWSVPGVTSVDDRIAIVRP
jgi:osmotically-inducible protein OsmY